MNKIIQVCKKLNQGVKINLKYILVKNDKLVLQFLKLLFKEGYLNGIELQQKERYLKIFLKYDYLLTPSFYYIKILSKKSDLTYIKFSSLTKILRLDTLILSNSYGFMTAEESIKNKLGGKLICSIF